jgi:transcriptional regulator with XRE-family HTH domain
MDRSASSARVLGSKTGRLAVENGDIGLLIRLVREALGWKQSDLGKEAGYSQPTISRLEKGQGRIGDLEVRARLADILEIPRSAVGLAGREPAGGGQRNLADMRRSNFLHGVLGAAASVALPAEVTNADRSRIGMATVRECASALNRLYELDERRGGATIYALATRMVSDIRTALARATYTAGVGRELRGVAALTAEHAGWLAYDRGRSEDARRWWLEALHLADLAGDSDARVTALVSMALQASTAEGVNGA